MSLFGAVLVMYVVGLVLTAPMIWRDVMRDARSLADDYAGSQIAIGAMFVWPLYVAYLLLERRQERP